MTSTVAIIPARGGSKGIPRKNLCEVGGVALVARSIAHARRSARVERVIVSTDDEEIADVARRAGAEVPFLRPATLAGDDVLDLPVFAHALTELRARGDEPDVVVHLRPTAPFRKAGWIDACVDLLRAHPDAHSVRSVSPVHQHPHRVFRVEDGLLVPVVDTGDPAMPSYLLRRQDLPPRYYYNCVVDVTRADTIARGSMTGTRMLPFIIPADDAFDIDTPRDLEIARWLAPRFDEGAS